mmetsp:Transcript_21029/g.29482  ORF Transcript_21029/g.29482 Transcript_21029/m.29482 type:complete len:95 (+) Transcript_21029:312-596(+)
MLNKLNKSHTVLFKHLECFNDTPNRYIYRHKVLLKNSHKNYKLKPNSKFTKLKEILPKFGWQNQSSTSESKSKNGIRSSVYYFNSKKLNNLIFQ